MRPHTDHTIPQRPYDPQQKLLLFQPKSQGAGLMGAVNGLLPHAYVDADSPVFTYELRDWTRGRTQRDLKNTLLMAVIRDSLFAIIIWGIAFFNTAGPVEQIYDSLWILVGVALAMGVLAGYVLDGFTVFITAFSNRTQQMDGIHHDLLSLSHVDTEHLVRARFAAAQVRVWNIMRTVIGVRLYAIWFAVLNVFAAPTLLDIDFGDYLTLKVIDNLGLVAGSSAQATLIAAVLLFGLVLVIEPLWRLRALSAAGMAAAGHRRGRTAVMLYAAAALVGIWLIQAVFLVVIAVIIFAFSASPTCMTLVLPIAAIFGGGSLRMLYFGLQFAWLRTVYTALHLSEA